MAFCSRLLLIGVFLCSSIDAFAPSAGIFLRGSTSVRSATSGRVDLPREPRREAATQPRMSAQSVPVGEGVAEGLMERERYIVFNRFNARDGAGPRFEKRWADRKSSLKTLDGFRFFQLLRRDDLGGSVKYDAGEPDYMSMTVWATKKNFNSWRTGYAFKEAHGGGSIGGFLSAVVGSAMVLKGPPAPAMWDALLPIATAPDASPIHLQGRDAEGKAVSDGSASLPAETFVAMNRFTVIEGQEAAFEARWAARESILEQQPGFFAFYLMRREGGARSKGGAPFTDEKFNYSTLTVWSTRGAFEAWRDGPSKTVHASSQAKTDKGEQAPLSQILEGSPSPIFWDGTLALESSIGA